MAYYIVPAGSPNHKLVLEARDTDTPTYPYIPSGHTISWRKNGIVVKSGSTGDVAMLRINTTEVADAHLTASDTGAFVDFEIDSGTFSNPVVLSNTAPTIESARMLTDPYGFVLPSPTIAWEFDDADGDQPWVYRVKIGTTLGGTELFDSGYIYLPQGIDLDGDGIVTADDVAILTALPGYPGIIYTDPAFDPAFDLNKDGVINTLEHDILTANMNGSPPVGPTEFQYALPITIPEGTAFFWTIEMTDGEKFNPFDTDYPPVDPTRVFVTANGTGTVNTSPICSNVLVNGQVPGSIVPVVKPSISWTYTDSDGQPQTAVQIVVAADPAFSNVLWDSGKIYSAITTVIYNFDNTGRTLPAHALLYVNVRVYDSFDDISASGLGSTFFAFASNPVLSNVLVDSKTNPLDLDDPLPTITWQKTDVDNDPLAGYEVRIADNSTDLGTDSFIGNVDATGIIVTPEAHQYTYRRDICVYGDLQDGVKYYFQVRVYDPYGGFSSWATGYFQLNAPPTAEDLSITPSSPYTSDSLTANYTFVDPGGTESDKTQIQWYKNGVEQSSLRNSLTVDHSYLSPGQSWHFTVRPHDGIAYGLTYTADAVVISNRAPTATIISLLPARPRKSDDLKASFLLDDPDDDPVTAILKWYKDGVDQTELRNSAVVPSSYLTKGDTWYFTLQPYDNYGVGDMETSDSVVVVNTPPEIDLILVEGAVAPTGVTNPNPTFKWRFIDEDGEAQSNYHLVIGTEPLRTSGAMQSILPSGQFMVNGIVSTASSSGSVLAGNDIFDSGSISSSDDNYKYVTEDDKPRLNLLPSDVVSVSGYVLYPDGSKMNLLTGVTKGELGFRYSGQSGTFGFTLNYEMDGRACKYALYVDSSKVDEFQAPRGMGSASQTMKSIRLDSGSTVKIVATPVDTNAFGTFVSLSLAPMTKFEVRGSDFDELSGYVSQSNGSIILSGLAGTATYAFQFPSSDNYDVELHYVTEASGNPSLVAYVNDVAIMNFTYESGAASRIRTATSVQISRGDVLSLVGTAQGGARARVSKLVFIPKETLTYGARLDEGRTYYASVKVNDGTAWSDWYTTRFAMSGSAWLNVSNTTGWTIEATFKLTS